MTEHCGNRPPSTVHAVEGNLVVSRHAFIENGRPVFPLHELFISSVILIVIAGLVYWLAGAWGVVMLWGFGVLFLLPMAVAPIGLFVVGTQEVGARRWASAAAHLAGSLLLGLAWLAAVGYCAYRGYLAIP